MANFIANLQSLYAIWLTASIYPRIVSTILLLSPLIITIVGMIMITRQINRGEKWTD